MSGTQCNNPYRKIIDDLDILVKSRFIEMFGTIDLTAQHHDWVPISKVGTILTGSTPKTNVDEYWGGDIKWITPAEIDNKATYLYDSERKLTQKGLKSCSLKMNPKGTVALSSRAPIGKVVILADDMYCNQGFKNIFCRKEINNVFLFTLLRNNEKYLNSLGRGATFKEISAKIVGDILIPLPPIERQIEFADFVHQVDKSKYTINSESNKKEDC